MDCYKQNRKFLILFVCIFSFNSCIKKKISEWEKFPLSETFRFNMTSEPPSLDWNKATDSSSALILDNIMEGLTDYDFSKETVGLQPALAEKWGSTSDRKTWTFTIREGVKWSDGKDLTARHFLDSWERLLNPQTASEYAYFLFPIKNAQSYNEGSLKDFSKVGVSINQNGQLVVELNEGKNYFPYLMSHMSTYPIRKDIIQKYGENDWTKPQYIVTLGAYHLMKWEHDKQIILERNTNYHGNLAKIRNVIIYMIPDTTAVLNLFEMNRLDAISNLPSRELPFLRKKKEYREHGASSIYYYGFNTKKKPFHDVRVRKAFNLAIDKKEIIELLQGGQTVLGGWIPKGLFGYDSTLGLNFDPKTALSLLDLAGYKDRTQFPRVVISYNTNEDHKRIAENIQAQLKKNLNIQVELSNQEWKSYLYSLKTGEQEIYRLGWFADYPDPDTFMNLMTSYSDNNHTYWVNNRYDVLVDKASSLPNGETRLKLYLEAQNILTKEEVPVIPLYSSQSHWLISDRVSQFPLNVMSQIQFKNVSFH